MKWAALLHNFSTRKSFEKSNEQLQKHMEAFMERENQGDGGTLKTTNDRAGRPGMWDDWLAFQKKLKKNKQRKEERREKLTMHKWLCVLYSICGLAIFVPTLFLF